MHLHEQIKLALVLSTFIKVATCKVEFDKKWIVNPLHDTEFPYTILIRMSRAEEEECSGSLVHFSWVLTAARCMYLRGAVVEDDTSLTLYAGVRDRYSRNSTSVQTRTSKKLFFHTATGNSTYGLVLVQVDKPFVVDAELGIYRVVVSDGSIDMKDVSCSSGSYGLSDWTGKSVGLGFKRVNVRPEQCSQCWVNFRKSFPDVISTGNDWFCSYSSFDQASMCRGDFGAGVVCDQVLQAVLVNLIKYEEEDLCIVEDRDTHDCGALRTRAVYADICPYLKWLSQHIANVKDASGGCYSLASKLDHNNCIFYIMYFLPVLIIDVFSKGL